MDYDYYNLYYNLRIKFTNFFQIRASRSNQKRVNIASVLTIFESGTHGNILFKIIKKEIRITMYHSVRNAK